MVDYDYSSFLGLNMSLELDAGGLFSDDHKRLLISREPWFKYTAVMIYTTLSLLSLFGNCIFCMVIARQRMLHSVTNLIMANLGLANIAFTLLSSPLFINKYILQTAWDLGEVLCKLSSSGVHLTATSSFYFIALVAVDRWLSVFSGSNRLNKQAAILLIILIWTVSLGITMPYIILFSVKPMFGNVYTNGNDSESSILLGSQKLICNIFPVDCDRYCAQRLELGTIIFQYFLPLCIILPCYTHLAVYMWKKAPIGSQTLEKLVRDTKRKRRVLSMLLSIVLMFILCWSPLFTLSILATFTNALTAVDALALFVAAHILVVVSVLSTPFLYLLNDAFRTELITLLKCQAPSSLFIPRGSNPSTSYSARFRPRPSFFSEYPTVQPLKARSNSGRTRCSDANGISEALL